MQLSSPHALPPHPRSVFALASVLLLTAAAHASVSEVITRSYFLTADGVISLSNISGNVEITAWDKPEVRLEAEKIASSDDALALLAVSIDMTPTSLTIKTEQKRKWKFWSLFNNSKVNYRLMVPAGVRLKKIDVVNSDNTVSGGRGPVDLDTVNGHIEATGLVADGRFETVNGSINAEYDSVNNAHSITLDTVNGSCTLRLPADATGHVNASTVNGRISCDFPVTLENTGRHSLQGAFGAGGPKIVLDSVNGGLHLKKK